MGFGPITGAITIQDITGIGSAGDHFTFTRHARGFVSTGLHDSFWIIGTQLNRLALGGFEIG